MEIVSMSDKFTQLQYIQEVIITFGLGTILLGVFVLLVIGLITLFRD